VQSQVFSFLVLSIVEETPTTGEVVVFVDLTTLEFSLEYVNTSTSQFWNFSTVLISGALVEVHIIYFNASSNVTFGDQVFYMAPNTFKLSMSVANWPFQTVQNVMRVWFENSAGGGGDGTLSPCVDSNLNSNGNLRWMKLNVGGVSSYSQMVEFAMVDGTKRYITYEAKNTSSFCAVIPFFWYGMQLDPNYGFLVDSQQTQEGCDFQPDKTLASSLGSRWEVYLAIPFGVVLIALVVLALNYFRIRDWYKRKGNLHSVEIDMDEE